LAVPIAQSIMSIFTGQSYEATFDTSTVGKVDFIRCPFITDERFPSDEINLSRMVCPCL